jgi:hypothetical protein
MMAVKTRLEDAARMGDCNWHRDLGYLCSAMEAPSRLHLQLMKNGSAIAAASAAEERHGRRAVTIISSLLVTHNIAQHHFTALDRRVLHTIHSMLFDPRHGSHNFNYYLYTCTYYSLISAGYKYCCIVFCY